MSKNKIDDHVEPQQEAASMPTILWMACTRQFMLAADLTNNGIKNARPIRHAHALEFWIDGTANFGENAEMQIRDLYVEGLK